MDVLTRRSNRAAAGRGNRALRAVLDDFEARVVAVEGDVDSTQAGSKSERGKIRAEQNRLAKRIEALEAAGTPNVAELEARMQAIEEGFAAMQAAGSGG